MNETAPTGDAHGVQTWQSILRPPAGAMEHVAVADQLTRGQSFAEGSKGGTLRFRALTFWWDDPAAAAAELDGKELELARLLPAPKGSVTHGLKTLIPQWIPHAAFVLYAYTNAARTLVGVIETAAVEGEPGHMAERWYLTNAHQRPRVDGATTYQLESVLAITTRPDDSRDKFAPAWEYAGRWDNGARDTSGMNVATAVMRNFSALMGAPGDALARVVRPRPADTHAARPAPP